MSDEAPDDGSPRGGHRDGERAGEAPRITPITDRGQLPEAEREHFDAIAESRGEVRGPFAVLLHSPPLAGRVAHLGAYVRFEGELPDAAREIAILVTAYEWDCAYEWASHEPIAREAGVEAGWIDAARAAGPLDELPETQAVVVRFTRELLGDHDVTEGTFRETIGEFGERGTVELTATVGYYSMLACVLNGFRLLPDRPAPF